MPLVHMTAEVVHASKFFVAGRAVILRSPHMLVHKVSPDVTLGLDHKAAQHAKLAASSSLLHMFSKQHLYVLHSVQEI